MEKNYKKEIYNIFPKRKTGELNHKKIKKLKNNLEYRLKKLQRQGYFPGIAIGIVVGKKLVFSKYIGLSHEKHLYGIASVTKTMTALGILFLVDRGLLDLEKPLSYYLPNVIIERKELNSKAVCIKHLLSHTSGLPDLRYYKPKKWIQPKTTQLNYKIPKQIYPTGKHYRYSNYNFILLGTLIEKVTRKKLADFLKTNVFLPLGMENTFAVPGINGAWGVRTNLIDLAKFASFWLNRGESIARKKKLSLVTMQKIFREQTYIPFAKNKRYVGLAWRIQKDTSGIVTFFHIGGAPRVAAWIQMFPGYNVAIFYLANPKNYENNLIGHLVTLQKQLGDLASEMVGSKTKIYQFEANILNPKLFPIYTGVYKNPLTEKELEIVYRNNQIFIKKYGKIIHLMPSTTSVFNFPAYEFAFSRRNNQVLGFSDYSGYYKKMIE